METMETSTNGAPADDLRQSERGSSASRPMAPSEDTPDLAALLSKLKAAQRREGPPDYDARIRHLDKLEQTLLARKHEIARAIDKDFGGRSKHETWMAEVMVVVNSIKHARAHLHEWMETQPRDVTWLFLPGRAEIVMQPVGVVGIISPWNYPVQLALNPLVSVLAAGNRAILKPSEFVPTTSALLKTLIAETFAADHVVTVTGGAEVSAAVSRLPLDHLVFTGSTRVGKMVMAAAAENLTPVTLELGGKSPVIVGENFSIPQAARKVLAGKCLNAGQTCIAPDYVLLPKGKADAFVAECRNVFAKMFPKIADNPDYTAIVNDTQYERLQACLKDARARGAQVIELGPSNEPPSAAGRKMALHILLNVPEDAIAMQEEIFGPILPVKTYETLDEAIGYVLDRPKPLALYFFDHDQKRVDKVLRETEAGGVCINETMLHIAQDDLPFGGVGPSGMGHYHAREGFETFTKKKPVFYQSRINGTALLLPPYEGKIDLALKLLLGK